LHGSYDLGDPADRARFCQTLIEHGETRCNEAERQRICHELGALLDVSYQEMLDDRRLSLLTPSEIRLLQLSGMDIQLHTRRHRICDGDQQAVTAEIIRNAQDLHGILPKPYKHFCYPSGGWQPQHAQWLDTLGIASATTCDSGMNTAKTNRLTLYRVLDSESLSDIRFEAEISGFGELLRILSGRRRHSDALRRQAATPSSAMPAGVSIPAASAAKPEVASGRRRRRAMAGVAAAPE
jgi:peptidoglycan/xylan/chitin deacetylase (PgdA/CDA1 family)